MILSVYSMKKKEDYKNDYMEKIEKLQNPVTSMSKLKDDKNEIKLKTKQDKVGGKSQSVDKIDLKKISQSEILLQKTVNGKMFKKKHEIGYVTTPIYDKKISNKEVKIIPINFYIPI